MDYGFKQKNYFLLCRNRIFNTRKLALSEYKIKLNLAILVYNQHFFAFSKYQLLSRKYCCPEFKKNNIKPEENSKFERLLEKSIQFEELNILGPKLVMF